MIDEQIRDGDFVIVEDRKSADNGEMVIALVGGLDVTLKKFYRENGKVRLQPANPTMQPLIIDAGSRAGAGCGRRRDATVLTRSAGGGASLVNPSRGCYPQAMDNRPPTRRPVHTHHHAVQFYRDDSELFKTVSTFLAEGLMENQPAVVIATSAHGSAILEHLAARHINVAQALRYGDLAMHDAEETLALFMIGDTPDPALFRRNVGDLLEQAVRGRERTPVRAYGEMVDVLWKRGAPDAAIRLEVLWNELASTHSISLLCGYSIGNFYKQTVQLDEVIRQHTRVVGRRPRAASTNGTRRAPASR